MGNQDDKRIHVVQNNNCCKKLSNAIVHALERFFYAFGCFIARHPLPTIATSLLISLLFVIGLKDMYEEKSIEKLWIPADSKSAAHSKWFSTHYPPEFGVCSVLVENDNVLSPSSLDMLCTIDEALKGISVNNSDGEEVNWSNTCFRPTKNGLCAPSTILQVWDNNCSLVRSLNQDQIQYWMETFLKTTPDTRGLQHLLAGIKRGTSNLTTEARVTKMMYFIEKSLLNVDNHGTLWEKAFNKYFDSTAFPGSSITYFSLTSFWSDAFNWITGDIKLFALSIFLALTYLVYMLGSFSRINHKVWLAYCCLACIGLATAFSFGFCSACKLFLSTMHSILPFLLLGIGIDDVFVIVQNWQLYGGGKDSTISVPDFMGKVMRHAGISILVTSITDICAFLIGATTKLPALRSFCIYSGIGIFAVFLLTCTFFFACLTLDTRRKRDRRDACCCCIRLSSDWQPLECSNKEVLQKFMRKYANVILSTPGRVCISLIAVSLCVGGVYGLLGLEVEFNFDNIVPSDAMFLRYKTVDSKYFPGSIRPAVYLGEVDYFRERSKLDELSTKLNENKYVVPSTVDSWYRTFSLWLAAKNATPPRNEKEFYQNLTIFLKTQGQNYQADIKFDSKTSKIQASRMFFTHIKLERTTDKIRALDSIQDLAKSIDFGDFKPFAYTSLYMWWETSKIMSSELIRNLILAGVVILVITLILLADILACVLVLICVVLTLINSAGYMNFWGLSIDIGTTSLLIIAIGLAVDYSAHIAHAFMRSSQGSRIDRAKDALVKIGPAVFHGGFSTFLAFIALAGSNSSSFKAFFKVLFLVVVFGMFHGLAFLPVLLSVFGPSAYGVAVDTEERIYHCEAPSPMLSTVDDKEDDSEI